MPVDQGEGYAVECEPTVGDVPEPATPEGKAGLTALLRDPGSGLVALDYDGTLAPIVADPLMATAHPGAPEALRRLSARLGTLAVITGRPAALAVDLGGLSEVPGIVVLGHYGSERWESGVITAPAPPAGLAMARAELPGLLAGAGAPPGTWVEDKGRAIAVHTRRTPDPDGALALVREPLAALAERAGLVVEPGRMVIELRPPGMDKGAALANLVAERLSRAVVFCGDDLGDLAAFAAVREFRSAGIPGVTVCSGSAEVTALAEAADLVVNGPDGVVALLGSIATALGG
jgi:trehalose 6-phosphate phosphatase